MSYCDIHQLDPESISYQIVCQDSCTLKPGIDPLLLVWISDVESSHRSSLDLIGRLRYHSSNNLLIRVRQSGRHG